eukprot:6443-Heterococcus_DN1.PRE.3
MTCASFHHTTACSEADTATQSTVYKQATGEDVSDNLAQITLSEHEVHLVGHISLSLAEKW